MNRDYDNYQQQAQPFYLPLGNYYGRPVDTNVRYQSTHGVQIVPDFAGVSYKKPNYNSLVHGSCVNHSLASNAYVYNNCVSYKARYDGPNGSYYAGATGATGATGANRK